MSVASVGYNTPTVNDNEGYARENARVHGGVWSTFIKIMQEDDPAEEDVTYTLQKRSDWVGRWRTRRVSVSSTYRKLTWEGGSQPGDIQLTSHCSAALGSDGTLVVTSPKRTLRFRALCAPHEFDACVRAIKGACCDRQVLPLQIQLSEQGQNEAHGVGGRSVAVRWGAREELTSKIDLAGARGSAGAYAEAECLLREAVAGCEAEFGEEDELTLRSVYVLGHVLDAQDKHEDAEGLHRRVLSTSR